MISGESVADGASLDPMNVIEALVVDDGVPGRGHRAAVFQVAYKYCAIATGGFRRGSQYVESSKLHAWNLYYPLAARELDHKIKNRGHDAFKFTKRDTENGDFGRYQEFVRHFQGDAGGKTVLDYTGQRKFETEKVARDMRSLLLEKDSGDNGDKVPEGAAAAWRKAYLWWTTGEVPQDVDQTVHADDQTSGEDGQDAHVAALQHRLDRAAAPDNLYASCMSVPKHDSAFAPGEWTDEVVDRNGYKSKKVKPAKCLLNDYAAAKNGGFGKKGAAGADSVNDVSDARCPASGMFTTSEDGYTQPKLGQVQKYMGWKGASGGVGGGPISEISPRPEGVCGEGLGSKAGMTHGYDAMLYLQRPDLFFKNTGGLLSSKTKSSALDQLVARVKSSELELERSGLGAGGDPASRPPLHTVWLDGVAHQFPGAASGQIFADLRSTVAPGQLDDVYTPVKGGVVNAEIFLHQQAEQRRRLDAARNQVKIEGVGDEPLDLDVETSLALGDTIEDPLASAAGKFVITITKAFIPGPQVVFSEDKWAQIQKERRQLNAAEKQELMKMNGPRVKVKVQNILNWDGSVTWRPAFMDPKYGEKLQAARAGLAAVNAK